MREPAWWEEVRRLTRRIVDVADEVPADDARAWLGAAADRRSFEVVSERFASGAGAAGLEPAAMLDREGPVWTDRLGDVDGATIGLDAHGAVATVRTQSRWGDHGVAAVGWRDPDGTEVLVAARRPGAREVSARGRLDDGATVVVRVEWEPGDDDEPMDPEVHLAVAFPVDGGRVRIERARVYVQVWEPGRPAAAVLAADEIRLGDDGEPEERLVDRTTRVDVEGGQPPDEVVMVAACAPDAVSLAEHGLRALQAPGAPGSATVLRWSRRLHGGWALEDPRAEDADEAAAALRDLIVAAAAEVDLPAPCALVLDWWSGDTRRSPPLPRLTVLDAAWRDRWRRLPSQWAAISRTRDAVEQGEGREIDLTAAATDRVLELWTPLHRAWWNAPGTTAPERLLAGKELARVRRRLLQLLLETEWPAPWAERVTPWLTFGPPGGSKNSDDTVGDTSVQPTDELREVGGADVAAALQEDWPVEDPGGTRTRTADGAADGPAAPTAAEASGSREALRRLLEHEGLEASAEALAARARWGWALIDGRQTEPTPRSRIGGTPLLPPGVPWPATADGAALTFIAVIDLANARGVEEPTVLPSDGLLLVFLLVGDIDPDEGILEFVEHEPQAETAVVLHVPAGTEPVEVPDPPAAPLEHDGYDDEGAVLRPFGLRPVLVPRDDWVAGREVGMHPSERERYQEVVWRVAAAGHGEDTTWAETGHEGYGGEDWTDDDESLDDDTAGQEPDEEGDTGTLHGGDEAEGASGTFVLGSADATGSDDAAMADAWRQQLEALGWLPENAADMSANELRAILMARAAQQDDDEVDHGAARLEEAFGTLLGDAPGAQNFPADEGELVLLSLDGSADLGLDWGDGGDVRILIREDDAAAGRWDRAWATGESS